MTIVMQIYFTILILLGLNFITILTFRLIGWLDYLFFDIYLFVSGALFVLWILFIMLAKIWHWY